MPGGEAALDLPQVADPGDRALVEQRVADRARRVVLAQAPQEPSRSSSSGARMSGPRPAIRRSRRVRESVISSSTGPSNCSTSRSPRRIRSHARARRARPLRAAVEHPPGAGHAQVRVDRQPALEAQEQVLAVGVDRAHRAAGQPLGPAVAAEARVRRRQLVRDVALEHRPDAVRARSGSCRPRASHRGYARARAWAKDPGPCGRSTWHACAPAPAIAADQVQRAEPRS